MLPAALPRLPSPNQRPERTHSRGDIPADVCGMLSHRIAPWWRTGALRGAPGGRFWHKKSSCLPPAAPTSMPLAAWRVSLFGFIPVGSLWDGRMTSCAKNNVWGHTRRPAVRRRPIPPAAARVGERAPRGVCVRFVRLSMAAHLPSPLSPPPGRCGTAALALAVDQTGPAAAGAAAARGRGAPALRTAGRGGQRRVFAAAWRPVRCGSMPLRALPTRLPRLGPPRRRRCRPAVPSASLGLPLSSTPRTCQRDAREGRRWHVEGQGAGGELAVQKSGDGRPASHERERREGGGR